MRPEGGGTARGGAPPLRPPPPPKPLRLLLPLLAVAAVAVAAGALAAALPAAAAEDPTAAVPTQGPGTAAIEAKCSSVADCSATGAVCERRKCACPHETPVVDTSSNRCIKAAGVNESCEVSAQCHWNSDLTDCVEGRCVCLYDMIEQPDKNGTLRCAVEGTLELGESCSTNSECGVLGSECSELCRCRKELPVTNKHDMCGKGAKLNEFCRFNEQCAGGLPHTECRNNRCRCMEKRVPYTYLDGIVRCLERGDKKIGDLCNDTLQCGYDNAICSPTQRRQCQCQPEFPITNGLDKCGLAITINQSCTFTEECEASVEKTECKDGVCTCRFGMAPQQTNGKWFCGAPPEAPKQELHLDPAMIGVLVGMALMFIILCVVLRLFSKARWRENRTIFNTPNPRLMNVSLLRDSKLLHSGAERRGSRASVRPPSRQPSMASLRPQSPSQSLGSRAGSRRGSRASSNASGTSTKSPKSPTRPEANNTSTPVLENVTVEVQDPKV